jgi:hypothetical protein
LQAAGIGHQVGVSPACIQNKHNNTNKMNATSTKPSRHVAIIAQTAALAAAMETALSEKLKGYTFGRVNKISERPAGASIASLGIPNFIPGTDGLVVHAFGTKFMDNATKSERDAQWDIVRNEASTPEQVLAELSGFRDYTILSQSKVVETKLALADVKLAIAEAETPEERLQAYKQGFELLQEALS